MEVGSAETTLNGGSADPMPVCIGDAQIKKKKSRQYTHRPQTQKWE